MRALVFRTVALSLGALTAGCTAATPDGPPTFSAIYPMLFPRATKYQCDFCHGLPANDISNGKLSMGMDQATAYAALVGQTSVSSKCAGMMLVVPGDPDTSLLLSKLSEDTPACGDRMPLAGKKLSASQITQVRTWILDGAMND